VITQRSRYRRKDAYRTRDSERSAEPIEALSPHEPEAMEVRRQHVVTAGERLDQIAARYYGDPLKYWLICDANDAIFPEDLLVPGRILDIPRNRL
jgi:nucleoid-associated protein YgaU